VVLATPAGHAVPRAAPQWADLHELGVGFAEPTLANAPRLHPHASELATWPHGSFLCTLHHADDSFETTSTGATVALCCKQSNSNRIAVSLPPTHPRARVVVVVVVVVAKLLHRKERHVRSDQRKRRGARLQQCPSSVRLQCSVPVGWPRSV
jgi:hypothetical protein